MELRGQLLHLGYLGRRHALGNGEPIVLYLPSPRMRAIFSDWLEGDDLIGLPEAQLAA